jgi:hypothetical protein
MRNLSVPGKNAKRYLERDKNVISPSYPRVYPFMMDHGAGSEVWDVDGNRYVDFTSGIAVCSTGHSHPKVVEAIQKQAERYIHISSDFYHPIWIEFSEKLASTAPFKENAKIFLGNSGTEAVEAAIKLARFHTGRQQFIGFLGGQQTRLPPWILPDLERCDACTLSGSLSTAACIETRRSWRERGSIHPRRYLSKGTAGGGLRRHPR